MQSSYMLDSPRRLPGHHNPRKARGAAAAASPSPVPHRYGDPARLLEPSSTPRRRSRTRPAGSAISFDDSPSPILHGTSYRSVDKSTLPAPTRVAGGPVTVPSPQRGGLSQAEYDAMLAEADRKLRRREHGMGAAQGYDPSPLSEPVSPTSSPAFLARGLGQSQQQPRPMGISPLTMALRAQWALLRQQQQQQQQQQYGSGSGYAHGKPSPALLAATEKDLLRALSALPLQEEAVGLQEAGDMAPYLLAFAVSPTPSRRTQAVALAALQGMLVGLVSTCGREDASEFARDLFLGENEALAAFDVALGQALAEMASDGDDLAARRAFEESATRTAGRVSSAGELRLAVMDSILGILFDATLLSPAIAVATLSQGQLLKNLVRYLPEATTAQAATIAGMLQAILDAPEPSTTAAALGERDPSQGERRVPSHVRERQRAALSERAAILAGYNAHHTVLNGIRASVRATYNGRGDLAGNATVTTLCVLIRVAVKLASAPAAFDVVVQEDGFSVLLAQLLTLPWGEVVELACLWLATLLARFPLREGPVLARNVLAKAEATQTLTQLLGWRERATFSYATSAALCWRWLFLSSSSAAGVAAAEPGVFLSFVHAILTNPLPEPCAATSADAEDPLLRRERRARALFTCELVTGVAAAFAVGTEYTRAAMHLLLMDRLTPDFFDALRGCVSATLSGLSDTYFDGFPTVVLESGTELCEAVVAAAAAGFGRRSSGSTRRGHGDAAGSGGGLVTSRQQSGRSSSRGSSKERGAARSRASSLSTSAASAHSRTQRTYESKFMNRRQSRSSDEDVLGEGGDGAKAEKSEEGSDREDGSFVVSTSHQWRLLVQCGWGILLSGEPSGGGTASSRSGSRFTTTPNRHSALKAPALSSTPQSLRLQRTPAPAGLQGPGAIAASQKSPSQSSHLSSQQQHLTIEGLVRQQRQHRPLPAYQQCEVVERAMLLADSGSFYNDSIHTVLRLAHQYVKAGVLGEAQLPLTGKHAAAGSAEVRAACEEERMRQYEASAFSLLLEERPQYLPLASVVLSASAERRRRSRHGRTRSRSLGSQGSVGSRDGQRERDRNPWAPPTPVGSSRRWHVKDLQRSDLLFFTVSYERLVPDIAASIAAVEAHVGYLRQQLQLCPTKAITRRLVLNDLHGNVYPKIHLFLRYIQSQVARSRAVLQLLSEVQDRGEFCLDSGNVIDVYDAVGHCVGEV